jgi:hypothetical protein
LCSPKCLNAGKLLFTWRYLCCRSWCCLLSLSLSITAEGNRSGKRFRYIAVKGVNGHRTFDYFVLQTVHVFFIFGRKCSLTLSLVKSLSFVKSFSHVLQKIVCVKKRWIN